MAQTQRVRYSSSHCQECGRTVRMTTTEQLNAAGEVDHSWTTCEAGHLQ